MDGWMVVNNNWVTDSFRIWEDYYITSSCAHTHCYWLGAAESGAGIFYVANNARPIVIDSVHRTCIPKSCTRRNLATVVKLLLWMRDFPAVNTRKIGYYAAQDAQRLTSILLVYTVSCVR